MGVLRANFCYEEKLDIDNVRFLLDGERIQDDDTPVSLRLSYGDVIEVYSDMRGGGPPKELKENISGDDKKILEFLDQSFDLDDCSISLDDGEVDTDDEAKSKKKSDMKRQKILADKIEDENTPNMKDNGKNNECFGIKPPPNLNFEYSELNEYNFVPANKETVKTDNSEVIEGIRKKYENDSLNKNNELDKKIIHLLNQPNLAPVEENTLIILNERRELFRTFNNDDTLKQPSQKKISKKPKSRPKKDFTPIKTRRQSKTKLENQDQRIFSKGETDTLSQEQIKQVHCTPNKRETLLSRFNVCSPSPLIKHSTPSENEMKMLSLAVHLYAEKKLGGTKMLQKVSLQDHHFKEIWQMAGPGSQYNLLKNRSIFQYKCLWRNTAKSKSYFRGHPETGFQNDMKLHSPTAQMCPFRHCQSGIESPMSPIDIDLILYSTKGDTNSSKNISKGRQQLFLEDREPDGEPKSKNKSFGREIFENCIDGEKPSPTKEELKRQNKLLQEKILEIEGKVADPNMDIKDLKPVCKKILIPCNFENCDKVFTTTSGLIFHKKKKHDEKKIESIQTCEYCGKNFLCIDKHMKAVHKNETRKFCDICQKPIIGNLKEHRGVCKSCPYCGKRVEKKLRLLTHIANCKISQNWKMEPLDNCKQKQKMEEQIEALDLSSPLKKSRTEGTAQTKLIQIEKQNDEGVIHHSSKMSGDELKNTLEDFETDASSRKGANNLSRHNLEGIGKQKNLFCFTTNSIDLILF